MKIANNEAEKSAQKTIENKGFEVQFLNSFTDEIQNRITKIFIKWLQPNGVKRIEQTCIITSNDTYINYSIEVLNRSKDFNI
jgi:hypothetical protein